MGTHHYEIYIGPVMMEIVNIPPVPVYVKVRIAVPELIIGI
jgi:hypothetical protein